MENVHFLMQLIKQKLKIINLTLSQFFSQKNIEKISYKNSITSKKNLSYFFFFLIIFLFPKKREEPNLSKQKTNRKKKLKKK